MPGKTASSALNKNKNNLTLTAYNILKEDIILNKIKAGDCLSGCQLAKRLNMSRTPVREALNILASEGFVEIRNGVGILVKKITEKNILEMIEVRAALECSALESRTLRIDRERLDQLCEAWQDYRRQIQKGRIPGLNEVSDLDFSTHDFIIRSSNNSYLIEVTHNISARFKQMQYLSVLGLGDTADTVNQHIEILESIQNGDIVHSAGLLKKHIQEAATYILDLIASREAPPKPGRGQ